MPSFDLVIKGGHVIDAANNVDSLMDVGVAGRVVGAAAVLVGFDTVTKCHAGIGGDF